MQQKDQTDGERHSHEAVVYLQSWRKAPDWWRGGCSCRTLGSTPPYRPETPRAPPTLRHRAWIKQNAPVTFVTSHFGEVIETEWNERFQRGRSWRSDKLLTGRGSPISVWLQEDVVSLLPCTGSSWCWCAHHGNRLRGVLCVGLSHFWENSYWKIERGKQISTFHKLVVLPNPNFITLILEKIVLRKLGKRQCDML